MRAVPIDLAAIASLDRLLHEPARLSVMTCLHVVEEADFVFLQSQTGLTGGNLSSHLKKLEAAGYLRSRRELEGPHTRTTLDLTPRGREALEAYLRTMDGLLRALRS